MIVAQRYEAHGANGDRIVDDDRTLFNRAEPQDAHVWLADDRHAEETAEHAWIGDGERTLLHFFWAQLLRPCAIGKVVHRALNTEDILLVGVLDARNKQPPI